MLQVSISYSSGEASRVRQSRSFHLLCLRGQPPFDITPTASWGEAPGRLMPTCMTLFCTGLGHSSLVSTLPHQPQYTTHASSFESVPSQAVMANLTLFSSYAPPPATSILPSGWASVGALPAPLAHLKGVPTVNECILPDGAKPSDQNTHDHCGFDWGAAACGSAATLLFAVPGTAMLTRNNKSTESAESQTEDATPPTRSIEQPQNPCSSSEDRTEHGAVQWVPPQVDSSQEDPYQLTSATPTPAPEQSYFERFSNLFWGDDTKDTAMEPLQTRYDVKAPVLWQGDRDRLKNTAAFYQKPAPEHVPIVLPKQPSLYPNTTTTGRSVSFGLDTIWHQRQSSRHQEGDQSQYLKDQSQYQDNQRQSQEDQSQYQDDQSRYREGGEGKSGQEAPRNRDDGWRYPRSWKHTDVLRNKPAVDAILGMPQLGRYLDSVRASGGTRNGWLRRDALSSFCSKRTVKTPNSVRCVPGGQQSYRTAPAWSKRGQAQPTAPSRQCQPTAPSPASTNTAAQQGIRQNFISSRAVASRHEATSNTTAPQSTCLHPSTLPQSYLTQTQTTRARQPLECLPLTTSCTSGQHPELPIFKGGETQPAAPIAPGYGDILAQDRKLQASAQQLRQQHAAWQQPQPNGGGHSVAETLAPPPSQGSQYRLSLPPVGSEQFEPAQGYQPATLTSSQLNTGQGLESLKRAPLGRGTSTDYTAPTLPSTAPPASWCDTSTARSSLRFDHRWGRQSLAGSSLFASQTGGNTSASPQPRLPPQRAVRRPPAGTQSGNTLRSIAEETDSGDSVTVLSQPPSVYQPRLTSTLDPGTAQVFTSPGNRARFGLFSARSATPALRV